MAPIDARLVINECKGLSRASVLMAQVMGVVATVISRVFVNTTTGVLTKTKTFY